MMTPTQHQEFLHEMKAHTEEVIVKTVNGKIEKLTKKLDEHIADDTEWKEDNQSALDNMRNLTSGWKVIPVTFVGFSIQAVTSTTFINSRLYIQGALSLFGQLSI